MKGKTYHTAAVIIPPRRLWSPIQAIRREHDRHLRRWMPHLTLLYPFRPREEFPDLVPLLTEICARTTPFDVGLHRFDSFRHESGTFTLWLEPQPKEPLLHLQRQLQEAAPNCDDQARFPGGFAPHLSVGQAGSEAALEAMRQRFQESWTPLVFTVAEVCLIAREAPPDDVFQVVGRIGLGRLPLEEAQ